MLISTRSRARSDDDGARANKRPKLEVAPAQAAPAEAEEADAQPALPQRHPVLWFDEGNVIVAACGRSFRLHSGVLAHHSDVFKELTSAPALAALEKLAGCAVLRVEDEGEVLAQLLQIMYDGGKSRWFRAEEELVSFAELRSVSIIAHKYAVQEVLDVAKAKLSRCYPSDSFKSLNGPALGQPESGVHYRDSIAVVQLCRLMEWTEMLPTALYQCATLPDITPLIDGVRYGEELVLLDDVDTALCLEARDQLAAEYRRTLKILFDFGLMETNSIQPASCMKPAKCRTVLARLASNALVADTWLCVTGADGIDTFLNSDGIEQPCTDCWEALMHAVDQRAKEVWDQLGEIFQVKPWPPSH
ncbi:BTB/POZ domain-containing protein [Phanerochaete sordida]|uniref:BTB/POZ domain-containing protein n=1 Tax=Phanerochaete sordida TaxID=48140 RepID=A0A9P3G8N6_9APHY|nr:BTB/POZ domain-containing protein [Phanerochaete sordida]